MIYMNCESVQPIIKLTVLCFQFPLIHPFIDGNGRTLRVLILQLFSDIYDEIYIFIILIYIKLMADTNLYEAISSLRNGHCVKYLGFWKNCFSWSDEVYKVITKLFCKPKIDKKKLILKIIELDYYLKMLKRDFKYGDKGIN
jgi:Fic/DOC family.